MTDELMLPQVWELPVLRAVDAIRLLPGLGPDHVEFDRVRFAAPSMGGPARSAMIHAYQPVTRVPFTVKFALRGTTYALQGHGPQPLAVADVATLLCVPMSSADRVVTLLKAGLTGALRIHNKVHSAPGLAGTSRPDRSLPFPLAPGDGRAVNTPSHAEPWPFAARTGAPGSSGPAL
ncbi:hypothetical protein [Promicromonospora sp. NPDC057488]|uniref:hypothetical protein n=1 Tax=Promicromonospora sp. NPDC057488 TaxID=3346147 RepID=UPI00367312E6